MTWTGPRSYPLLRSLSSHVRRQPLFPRLSGLWIQRATYISVSTLNRDLLDIVNQPINDISGLTYTKTHIHMQGGHIHRGWLFYANVPKGEGEDITETETDDLDTEPDNLDPASLDTRDLQQSEPGITTAPVEAVSTPGGGLSATSVPLKPKETPEESEEPPLPSTIPFPPGTRGYLYYQGHPRFPLIAGGVRFRVLPEGAEDFEAGHDLQLPNGKPWVRVLNAALVNNPGIMAKLIEENLVLKNFMELRRQRKLELAMRPVKPLKPIQKSHTEAGLSVNPLYKWDDTFFLDLEHTAAHFSFVKWTEKYPFHLWYLFRDRRPACKKTYGASNSGFAPYRGVVAAHFELSSLPEHTGDDPHVVIRILQIVQPVSVVVHDYDGFVNMPVEGELLSRGLGSKRLPLSFPLNEKPRCQPYLRKLFLDATNIKFTPHRRLQYKRLIQYIRTKVDQ
ncbi:hypothetical protein CPB84DRAFT_1730018 [Gymnopilus junonius]|uniref:Uncharacterized protein n=1 Tax=Gymnopilus junonius TaxID=109634 RepID=A0A9P5TMF3_GYMJU|nr:hypothetical protein CPB84DRAFT_1730018 [Gymnopilus junonius]